MELHFCSFKFLQMFLEITVMGTNEYILGTRWYISQAKTVQLNCILLARGTVLCTSPFVVFLGPFRPFISVSAGLSCSGTTLNPPPPPARVVCVRFLDAGGYCSASARLFPGRLRGRLGCTRRGPAAQRSSMGAVPQQPGLCLCFTPGSCFTASRGGRGGGGGGCTVTAPPRSLSSTSALSPPRLPSCSSEGSHSALPAVLMR